MKKSQPSNLELQVLSLLWEHGPLAARQVLELLPDKKNRAYTTVLSVMQVMEKKGLIRHEESGNRNIYHAAVKKQDVLGSFFRSLISHVFGGSASNAMQHLLQTTPVTREELEEMKGILNSYTQSKSKNKQ